MGFRGEELRRDGAGVSLPRLFNTKIDGDRGVHGGASGSAPNLEGLAAVAGAGGVRGGGTGGAPTREGWAAVGGGDEPADAQQGGPRFPAAIPFPQTNTVAPI